MSNSELMAAFLAEMEEQLQQLEQGVLKLEQQGGSDAIIQDLFRSAHTLKGSSAVMGFEEMKNLTHEMENVLDRVRSRKLTVTLGTIDVLFECLDVLGVLKQEMEAYGQTRSSTTNIVGKLRAHANGEEAGTPDSKIEEEEVSGFQCDLELKQRLEQALQDGKEIYKCEVTFSPSCDMKAARAFIAHSELSAFSTIVSTCPSMEEVSQDGDISMVMFLLITDQNSTFIEQKLYMLLDIEEVKLDPVVNRAPKTQPVQSVPSKGDSGVQVRPGAGALPQEDEVYRRSAQTIRVDVDRLENLMNLVGELVIDQTRVAQASSVLRDTENLEEALDDLDQISNHITRVISELQESVMKTRMLPIEQLFSRFPRMVRDLSHSLGKEIDLRIEGKETELDRTVIEEIGDPLIHLVRNAIDHGIESTEQRMMAGKVTKGTVRLTAAHQENQVVITVEDDGRGIPADHIKSSAIRKGLITPQAAETMLEQELIHLIFEPGFSTSETVSDVSGRGVGMDIVRSHIEKLGGLIDVETKPGEGTKFTIKLPLTLAILRGLLIKLNERTFALPMTSVVEIVRIPTHEIYSVKGQAVVKIRERVLPITWLHDHFRIPRSGKKSQNVFVVILGTAEKRLGLIVDELIGNQEIVVKSIGSYIGKVDGISGATILGDGSVALILDVTGVFKLASAQKSSWSGQDDIQEVAL